MGLERFFKNKRYEKYGLKTRGFKWMKVKDLIYPPDTPIKDTHHVALIGEYLESKGWVFEDMDRFKETKYYQFHKKLRDNNVNADRRTDGWILYKGKNLIKIYINILRRGFHYRGSDGSYIAVKDGVLFDGGHRAA